MSLLCRVGGLVLALGAGAAAAAEPSTDLPAGGLVYAGQPTLITRLEDIAIGVDAVRVKYTIVNVAADARRYVMAFALPDIDMMALDGASVANAGFDPANPANYVGFSAAFDGLRVEPQVEARALSLGLIDASARLRELGLPLYPMHPEMGNLLAALPESVKTELVERSMMRIADGQPEAMWTLKTTLHWVQPVASSQPHTVEIAYRPISGDGVWNLDTAAALQQRYCVPQAAVDALNRRAAAGKPADVRALQFLASMGASARGAVGEYRVALEPAGKQQVYTCREGLVVTGSAVRRATAQSDAMPDDDIQVLFVE